MVVAGAVLPKPNRAADGAGAVRAGAAQSKPNGAVGGAVVEGEERC